MQTATQSISQKPAIEEQIVALLSRQDKQAVRLIFDYYGSALMNIISRVIQDKAMAEEVLQQVLIKVWRNAGAYNAQKAGLYSWLVAISRNAALDKRKTRDFKEGQTAKSAVQIFALDNEPNGENSLEKLMARQLLEQLPDKYRLLINMSFFEGYSHQEIADQLEVPLGTVKTRIRSALKHLRSFV
ncbi:RNA polymerase sigma factor [Roseivirga sp.]|uniref:RNA polymerase sigma factor n=1 Tax=Roseivirga sp. TaxID=1964215 RepID=UPI003B523A79